MEKPEDREGASIGYNPRYDNIQEYLDDLENYWTVQQIRVESDLYKDSLKPSPWSIDPRAKKDEAAKVPQPDSGDDSSDDSGDDSGGRTAPGGDFGPGSGYWPDDESGDEIDSMSYPSYVSTVRKYRGSPKGPLGDRYDRPDQAAPKFSKDDKLDGELLARPVGLSTGSDQVDKPEEGRYPRFAWVPKNLSPADKTEEGRYPRPKAALLGSDQTEKPKEGLPAQPKAALLGSGQTEKPKEGRYPRPAWAFKGASQADKPKEELPAQPELYIPRVYSDEERAFGVYRFRLRPRYDVFGKTTFYKGLR